ncbi:MAG: transglycosylase SLT domain-containing protein [Thermodesulfovibrionales bacterium]
MIFWVPSVSASSDTCSDETFLLARQYLQSFEFQKAIDTLKDLEDCVIVSDLVLFMKAEALSAFSSEDARKTYEKLIHTCEFQPCSPLLVRKASFALIELLLLDDRNRAIKELERYIEKYPFDDYANYLLAYLKEKDGLDVSSIYRRLFIKNSSLSSLIKDRIDYNMLGPEEFEEKIKGLLKLVRYDEAELAIKKRLEEEKDPLRIENLRRLLGNIYFKKKRYREAAEEFLLSKEYYMLGLSYLRSGNDEEAKKVIDRLINARDRRVVPLAIAFARTLRDRGNFIDTINYLERLLKYFPFDSEQIQWAIAWTHYRTGNYEEAKNRLLELQKKYKRPRYDYWLLRIAELRKEIPETEEDIFLGYRKLVEQDSGFYSLLARQRLEKLEDKKVRLDIKAEASGPSILQTLTASFEDRSHDDYKTYQPDWHPKKSDDFLGTPVFRRFSIFLKLGLREELTEEITALVKDCMAGAPSWELPVTLPEISSNSEKQATLRTSYSLYFSNSKTNDCKEILKDIGFFFYSTGQYYRAVALYSRLKTLPEMQARIDDRFLYPFIYPELLLNVSRLYAVDPYLLLSIIREESRYNPGAISPAGAMGLMQIMPYTAERLIRATTFNHQERSQKILNTFLLQYRKNNSNYLQKLYDPELNIHLGALYFKRLLEQYKEIPLAIAAYNAGEGAVDSWLKKGYSSVDEFIEDIPYGETMNYVKRVLTTYEKYLRIYGMKR